MSKSLRKFRDLVFFIIISILFPSFSKGKDLILKNANTPPKSRADGSTSVNSTPPSKLKGHLGEEKRPWSGKGSTEGLVQGRISPHRTTFDPNAPLPQENNLFLKSALQHILGAPTPYRAVRTATQRLHITSAQKAAIQVPQQAAIRAKKQAPQVHSRINNAVPGIAPAIGGGGSTSRVRATTAPGVPIIAPLLVAGGTLPQALVGAPVPLGPQITPPQPQVTIVPQQQQNQNQNRWNWWFITAGNHLRSGVQAVKNKVHLRNRAQAVKNKVVHIGNSFLSELEEIQIWERDSILRMGDIASRFESKAVNIGRTLTSGVWDGVKTNVDHVGKAIKFAGNTTQWLASKMWDNTKAVFNTTVNAGRSLASGIEDLAIEATHALISGGEKVAAWAKAAGNQGLNSFTWLMKGVTEYYGKKNQSEVASDTPSQDIDLAESSWIFEDKNSAAVAAEPPKQAQGLFSKVSDSGGKLKRQMSFRMWDQSTKYWDKSTWQIPGWSRPSWMRAASPETITPSVIHKINQDEDSSDDQDFYDAESGEDSPPPAKESVNSAQHPEVPVSDEDDVWEDALDEPFSTKTDLSHTQSDETVKSTPKSEQLPLSSPQNTLLDSAYKETEEDSTIKLTIIENKRSELDLNLDSKGHILEAAPVKPFRSPEKHTTTHYTPMNSYLRINPAPYTRYHSLPILTTQALPSSSTPKDPKAQYVSPVTAHGYGEFLKFTLLTKESLERTIKIGYAQNDSGEIIYNVWAIKAGENLEEELFKNLTRCELEKEVPTLGFNPDRVLSALDEKVSASLKDPSEFTGEGQKKHPSSSSSDAEFEEMPVMESWSEFSNRLRKERAAQQKEWNQENKRVPTQKEKTPEAEEEWRSPAPRPKSLNLEGTIEKLRSEIELFTPNDENGEDINSALYDVLDQIKKTPLSREKKNAFISEVEQLQKKLEENSRQKKAAPVQSQPFETFSSDKASDEEDEETSYSTKDYAEILRNLHEQYKEDTSFLSNWVMEKYSGGEKEEEGQEELKLAFEIQTWFQRHTDEKESLSSTDDEEIKKLLNLCKNIKILPSLENAEQLQKELEEESPLPVKAPFVRHNHSGYSETVYGDPESDTEDEKTSHNENSLFMSMWRLRGDTKKEEIGQDRAKKLKLIHQMKPLFKKNSDKKSTADTTPEERVKDASLERRKEVKPSATSRKLTYPASPSKSKKENDDFFKLGGRS